jgi:hypothetical protein
MNAEQYSAYAGLCGLALARAHARSGDSVAIAAYLGNSSRFAQAMQTFAAAYAEQTSADFALYQAAIAAGEVSVISGSEDNLEIRLTTASDGQTQVTAEFRPAQGTTVTT